MKLVHDKLSIDDIAYTWASRSNTRVKVKNPQSEARCPDWQKKQYDIRLINVNARSVFNKTEELESLTLIHDPDFGA